MTRTLEVTDTEGTTHTFELPEHVTAPDEVIHRILRRWMDWVPTTVPDYGYIQRRLWEKDSGVCGDMVPKYACYSKREALRIGSNCFLDVNGTEVEVTAVFICEDEAQGYCARSGAAIGPMRVYEWSGHGAGRFDECGEPTDAFNLLTKDLK